MKNGERETINRITAGMNVYRYKAPGLSHKPHHSH